MRKNSNKSRFVVLVVVGCFASALACLLSKAAEPVANADEPPVANTDEPGPGQLGLAIVLMNDFPKKAAKDRDGKEFTYRWIEPDKDGNYQTTFKIVHMLRYPWDGKSGRFDEEQRSVETVEKTFPQFEVDMNVYLQATYVGRYHVMELRVVDGKYVGLDDWELPELPKLTPAWTEIKTK